MRVLLLESSPVSRNPTNMHVKNAWIIKNYLDKIMGVTCDLISIASGGDSYTKSRMPAVLAGGYDVVLVNYSSPYTHIDLCKKIISKNPNAKYGWITTDYEITPHGVFDFDFYISNFTEGHLKRKYKDYLFLNLNSIIYKGLNDKIPKKYDCVYYSRYRKNRVGYVNKYDHDRMILSTNSKNVIKYRKAGVSKSRIVGKLNWNQGKETLNYFKASLYIEDIKTHTLYNNLANRFYECLQCNVPMFFDSSCAGTVSKSQYPISDYFIVNTSDELFNKIDNLDSAEVSKYIKLNDVAAKNDRDKTLNTLYGYLRGSL